MSQPDDEEIQRLQKIQSLRNDRERHMAEYVKLIRQFGKVGDGDTKERAQELIQVMKKLDDQVAELLKR
jgi:hypothetical protein